MKTSFLTAIFLSVSILILAQTPTFEWANSIGGPNSTGNGNSIVFKGISVYTTGNFQGQADFDPGAAVVFLSSAGREDIFISKSSAAGALEWVKQIGGADDDIAKSIAVDGLGNVYTTGYFSGIADFDPGPGTYNLSSVGAEDIFISKLDGLGNFVWAKQFGGTTSDFGNAVAIDAGGNVYVAGDFSGTADFYPGAPIFNLNSFGLSDIFVVKLNSSGAYQWAKQLGGSSDDHCYSIAIDGSDNVLTTGNFSSTADFDPSFGVFNLASAGGKDIFISKLNAAGNFVWAKQFSGLNDETAFDIATDASGNIYTTGDFFGTCDFDPGAGIVNLTSDGSSDCFLSKLDNNGNFSMAKRIGGSYQDRAISMTLDASSNIYVTGGFSGTVDFDPGTSVFNLTGQAYIDIFVLKLNNSGNLVWAQKAGGDGIEAGNSIAVNSAGNVYYTGFFRGLIDFDPGSGTFNLNNSSGDFWPFFSQLNSFGNFVWASTPCIYAKSVSRSTAVNSTGDIINVGQFLGTIDFDPGVGVFQMSTDSLNPWGDIFITKTSSDGSFMWAKQLRGTWEANAYSVKTDANGNIYLSGYFQKTVDFDPGASTFNLTANGGNLSDIFLMKLDSNGNFIWANRIGAASYDTGRSLSIDATGNLYITGTFSGTVDFDPGPAILNLVSLTATNTFVAKFNDVGNLIWAKQTDGSGGAYSNFISTDNFGNVYYLGYFNGTTDFDPGAGVTNLAGTFDCFVSKLDNSGNFVWVKQFGGTGYDISYAMALDSSSNLYITGEFVDTVDFDPDAGIFNLVSSGFGDVFISKLDSSGAFLWANKIGGLLSDGAYSIALDASTNIYLTGHFSNIVDFNPGPAIYNLTGLGSMDIFLAKLDGSGSFLWAYQFGGDRQDVGLNVLTDSLRNIYLTGSFMGVADFDPGTGTNELQGSLSADAFFMKLKDCSIPLSAISASGPISFCSGGSVTLNASTGSGLTYQWQRNGISIPGAVNSSYVATTAGNYRVLISSSSICMETSNNIRVTVPCIPIGPNHERGEMSSGSDEEVVKLYPNPTTGIFVIHSPEGQLEVINSYGQLMRTYLLTRNENTFDLSELPNGIYILKLNTGKSSITEKILVNH